MRHLISTIGLAPILLWQGRTVRRDTPELPEAAGKRRGQAGVGKPLRLLIIGDSAAAGVGAEHQQQALSGRLSEQLAARFEVHWRLFARSGETTASTLERLYKLGDTQFDIAVTSLGVNDVTGQVNPRRWLRQQRQLRELLKERHGIHTVIVSGLPPMRLFPALPQPLRWYLGSRAQDFDRLLEADLEDEDGSHFLSLDFEQDPALIASDGFHPGPGAYVRWAEQVSELINQLHC